MKISCDTIQDILPLVIEDLASTDTIKLLNEHTEECEACRQEYDEIKEKEKNIIEKDEIEAIPLKSIKRKLKKRKVYFIILTSLIVSLISLIALDKLTKPIALSYDEAIESFKMEDNKVFIDFTSEVSNYQINSYGEIKAWKTIISNLDKNRQAKNTVFNITGEESSLYYVSQKNEVDNHIYGPNKLLEDGGRITLPRLSMNYYLVFMTVIFLVFLFLWIILRKKDKFRKIRDIILMMPLSYIISHILILGLGGITHHMIRDFYFVIIGSVLVFSIFIGLKYREDFIK